MANCNMHTHFLLRQVIYNHHNNLTWPDLYYGLHKIDAAKLYSSQLRLKQIYLPFYILLSPLSPLIVDKNTNLSMRYHCRLQPDTIFRYLPTHLLFLQYIQLATMLYSSIQSILNLQNEYSKGFQSQKQIHVMNQLIQMFANHQKTWKMVFFHMDLHFSCTHQIILALFSEHVRQVFNQTNICFCASLLNPEILYLQEFQKKIYDQQLHSTILFLFLQL
ncbi:Hypothetical_protein [Hexamita inflata]|uniref:Hypothetical_protein n=1 Tax=Hexamita inflata TaxID=28002 RepID=A0AA86THN0_9EUKA|nr:Hypothetical protein HINF_LOCUS3962 [Hexamita inflata]